MSECSLIRKQLSWSRHGRCRLLWFWSLGCDTGVVVFVWVVKASVTALVCPVPVLVWSVAMALVCAVSVARVSVETFVG